MTLTIEEMKANRKLWVEALRSGKYRQTKSKLKARNGAMCCLGVLADLAGCEWKYDPDGKKYLANDEAGFAPFEAMDFVGLKEGGGGYERGQLSDLNDEGTSFKEIAAIIESEPPGLFIDSTLGAGE